MFGFGECNGRNIWQINDYRIYLVCSNFIWIYYYVRSAWQKKRKGFRFKGIITIPYEFTNCDFSCSAKSIFAHSILVLAKWHFALHFVTYELGRHIAKQYFLIIALFIQV